MLGVPLGLMAGWFVKLNYALDPWLNFFNALPRVALLPVLVIVFGAWASESKIAVVFLGSFFSDPDPHGPGGADRGPSVPGCGHQLPRLASDCCSRPSWGSPPCRSSSPACAWAWRAALIGVVTGELYAATDGLGVIIRRASESRQGDRMLFGVLLFTVRRHRRRAR